MQDGVLQTADGLRVPQVRMVVEEILNRWGCPAVIMTDRARYDELIDAHPPCRVKKRITRYFGAAEDIRAFRQLVLDGGLSVDPASRGLLTYSIGAAVVKNDEQGSFWLVRKSHNVGRDDVAVAAVLAAGEFMRRRRRPASKPLRFVME